MVADECIKNEQIIRGFKMWPEFDALSYKYPSRRRVVYGKNGMVCTTQPLAAGAGLEIMKKGGNAVDAAIATAACLTVTEPNNNGIGGDAFALCWIKDKLYGLNASGPAPMAVDAAKFREKYGEIMPAHGWAPVTVPGIPSAWAELSKRFGKLPLKDVLAPAIDLAENGFPVAPSTAYLWDRCFNEYKAEFNAPELMHWFDTFAPKGRGPKPGETIYLKDHAETLRELAATGCESFYQGALADEIDSFSKATGGYLRKEDLAAFRAEWVEPISVDYRGYTVSEIPPNGHGLVVLMALKILSEFKFTSREDAETVHKQLEAMKLAFTDGKRYIADPKYMKATVEKLLSDEYIETRRSLIGKTAMEPMPGQPYSGDTVYFCTADCEGNMVSFIESNYKDFGSGIVVPGTGIALHDRGNNFYLDPKSENCIAPGKKPYHTIIPGFLSKDGKPVGPFGVMGGFMQPQGQLQVVMNTVDFGMNPQEALDAPRWQWTGSKKIELEMGFDQSIAEELIRKGHEISVLPDSYSMGRGQIIWRSDDGVLCGATEPRSDGSIAAW